MVRIHKGVLLSHEKEVYHAIGSNMDRPRDCHNEWRQSERHLHMISLSMWNLKNRTNELIYKTQTDSQP